MNEVKTDLGVDLNTTHRGLSSGNPHSVTPTELSLVIGTDVQAHDAELDKVTDGDHDVIGSGNPHSVTPTELSLVIGTNTQAHDAGLDSLAALSYAAASFVKMTGANTFALRTIGETADDLEGTIDHDNLANGGAHDYAYISSNDAGTGITAIELEELTDGSETALHSHTPPQGDIPVTVDSESNNLVKAHAYKAQTAGFVDARVGGSVNLLGYVGVTDDPVGAGTMLAYVVTTSNETIHFFVASGKYFEITSSGAPTIAWTPLIAGGDAPIDQD